MRKSVNLTQTSIDKGHAGLPRHRADAETTRLMRLVESQRYADVERVAREYLNRNGRHPLALKALSFALVGLGRFKEVISVAERALVEQPGDGELHNNRAIALAELMRWEEAIAAFGRALELSPLDPEIHKNLGMAMFRINRWNEAAPPLLKAIELHPGDYLEAIELLSQCLFYAKRMDEAYSVCRALHDENPDDPYSLCRMTDAELYRCSWGDVEANLEKIERWVEQPELATSPWVLFKYWRMGMREYRLMAERFATRMIPEVVRKNQDVLSLRWTPGERPLRVGYLSSDFGDHPVSNVIVELIERHDRTAVETFAYALRPDDGAEMRRRIESAFDGFVAADRMSVREIADRIRADRIDILVDLNGWTTGSRPEVLALRSAPIQVNWLGYAGTMGWTGLADFVVGDPVATPETDDPWFFERVVRMPHSYMPVDTRHRIGPIPSRASQDLPENAFVLCSFNNSYKLNPPLFDCWCSLLRQMPDAVLWLSKGSDTAMDNLRNEALRRGIAAERLVFAKRAPERADYLGRIGLADLALDTFPYGSHSTGVDVLLAGVPMVTKLGTTFAARVGASLMYAAELPEMVATDEVGYMAIVLDLYRDRVRLGSFRERLKVARASAPLFDITAFARDLEALYIGMAETMAQALPHDAPDLQVPATGA
jgi:protein O-GlcNAc transferase